MITLELLEFNPFTTLKEFETIWPHRGYILERDFDNYLKNPKDEVKYLILSSDDGTNNTSRVIGCTGIWIDKEPVKTYGLSWHGLLPPERKKGYSKQAFDLLCQKAKERYTDIREIEEWLPEDKETVLRSYFESLGFQKTNRSESGGKEYPGINWLIYSKNI